MPRNASVRSKSASTRRAAEAPSCWLKVESPDPVAAIANEPLLPPPGSASALPAYADADEVTAPRRSIPRRPRQCTIGYRYYDVDRNGMRIGLQVPSLRLHGLWLEGIGFAVGGKVRITMANGALLITAEPAAPPAAKRRRGASSAL